MRVWLITLLAVLAATASAAASPPRRHAPPPRPILLVISLDGFRAEYLSRGLTPHLDALARGGVRASAMRPAFPSVTSPNHYTLMTGLWPDHHGVVYNEFIDPKMPGLRFGGPHGDTVDADPRWWSQATPLWVTAERAGLKTAASDWPGDEGATIGGVKTSYIAPRSKSKSAAAQMNDQLAAVLGWMQAPSPQRPALILLHFDVVDLMGHLFGPDSTQVNTAIGEEDAALGDLFDALEAKHLLSRTNIVIVSDHGMTAISPDRVIPLDDLVDVSRGVVPTFGAETGFDPADDYRKAAEAILLAPHDHLTCWRRKQIPPRLHYGSNPRTPQIFCLAAMGWSVGTKAQFTRYPRLLGNHGYDPAEADMKAIFIAHGPAFRSGATLPEFDNVEVYPLLASLLGVRPERHETGPRTLRAARRPAGASASR